MPVKNPIDCFKNYGVSDLSKKLQQKIEEGANPYEAARELIVAEHRRIHNTANEIRTKGKLKPTPYAEQKDISQELQKIKQPKPAETTQPEAAATSKKGVIKKARGIEDLTEPRDIVLQYFAGGNRINSSAIQELFGGGDDRLHFGKKTGGEQKAKISLIKKDAPSIKELAHQLWEQNGGLEEGYQYTDRDFRDAIEAVLQEHNSPTSMSVELVDKYINKAVKQELTENEAKEISDIEIAQLTKYVNELPENQQEQLVEIIKKYQDKFGFVDWEQLEKDSNGFDPEILSLTIQTQEALDGIIQKNIQSGQGELSNTTRQNSRQEEVQEEIILQEPPGETLAEQPPIPPAKQLAGKIRGLKIDLSKLSGGGLQSNIAGIPIALWNAAIDTIAFAIESGATLAQAVQKAIRDHKLNQQPNFNQKEFISKLEAATGETFIEEPIQPPTEPVKEDSGEGAGKKKSTLNRLYEAKNMPERARAAFEREGLEYVPASQEEAAAVAKATVDELGIDEAINLAAAGTFDGGVNAMIFGEVLNRLADNESDAGKWAEVAIQWDKYNRVRGQDISAINFFYKHSPLGVVLKENADRKKQFDEWAKGKNQSWEEYFEELMKQPDFESVIKEYTKEKLKQERQQSRQKREAKVRDIFKKAKVSKGQAYSTIISPAVWNAAVDLMEKLYLAGEEVVEVVQRGIDYINTELKGKTWDSDKFRKEWETQLSEKGGKAPLTDEELKAKVLDKFRKKLKGLTEKEKDEVIRKAYKKIIESGGLDYDEFKEIIARVTGRGELTEEQKRQLKEMAAKTNAAGEAAKVAQEERTPRSLERFYAAEIEAGRAARDLRDIFRQKPDIIRRLTSIMQLSTLGAVSLVANVTYNIWNQLALRYPIGLINDTMDRIWGGIGRMMGKPSVQEYNVWEAQGAFWNKMGQGVKESFEQIGSGLNRQDYTQKELYGQQMRPFKAWRELLAYARGKRPLTRAEWWDKLIEGTAGIPAEIVARFLNVGDKPLRFGAQGAQAKAFTKALGLKDIDEKLFIEFPKEEAYRYYKGQGLSDEVAQQKADYISEAIIKEGARATLQQDNLLNDAITRAAGVLPGGKDSGLASAAKMFVISPYIKIPTNAFWSYYNLVNPEVAIMQSLTYAGLSKKAKNKGDITKAQLMNREARYWMAHAMLGMGLRAVVIAMVQAGMVTPPPDDEESKKERDAIAFFDKPGTIQIGDSKIQTKWFGQLGALANSIARKYFDATPEQRQNQDEFWNVVWGGMELDALKELENGIFANSSSLFQSISSGDWSRYGINTINLLSNIVQPATIAQLNRAALDEVPTSKGDSFLDKLNQNFAQRSTLYRRIFDVDIYKKQDIFGRPIPKGGNLLSRMFGVSKANPELELRELYDDYLRTGDSGFLPPAVPTKIGETKLNMKQQEKLAEYIGEERLRILRPYVSGAAEIPIYKKPYDKLTDEKKKQIIQSIYESGRQNGLEKFYQEYKEFMPKKLTPKEEVEKAKSEIVKELINNKKP